MECRCRRAAGCCRRARPGTAADPQAAASSDLPLRERLLAGQDSFTECSTVGGREADRLNRDALALTLITVGSDHVMPELPAVPHSSCAEVCLNPASTASDGLAPTVVAGEIGDSPMTTGGTAPAEAEAEAEDRSRDGERNAEPAGLSERWR